MPKYGIIELVHPMIDPKMVALPPHRFRRRPKGPLLMVIMDGLGLGRQDRSDAVFCARTPHLDWLQTLPSATKLQAHGLAVGMPSNGDMGNSEVGHNAIGSGQILSQGAKLVEEAIRSESMFFGETWLSLLRTVQASSEAMHLIGLLSDGNVHSHIDHLLAIIRRAASDGVKKLRIHILLDGRDVEVRSALRYIEQTEEVLASLNDQGLDYRIASGGGRMSITMDRYGADWEMVSRGWAIHVHGEGRRFSNAKQAVETYYEEHQCDDQWLPGFVIGDEKGAIGPIEDGAAVVLFNFRGDRAIEICQAFESENFDHFERGRVPKVNFAGMMQYDGDLQIPTNYLVDPPCIANTMGELVARSGLSQLAVAETHKFGHVTYFWNGNRSGKFEVTLEDYVEIESDNHPVEFRPWMRAAEVTDVLIESLVHRPYDLVRVNYANADMVGHTGNFDSTRMAVEAVDLCLGRLITLTKQLGGILLVTADHGNADHMFDVKAGKKLVRTSHSLHPVPFAIFDPREAKGGPRLNNSVGGRDFDASVSAGIANIAATGLELMGFAPPENYEASLLSLDPS